jgi:hypothetical protein
MRTLLLLFWDDAVAPSCRRHSGGGVGQAHAAATKSILLLGGPGRRRGAMGWVIVHRCNMGDEQTAAAVP